MNPIPVKMLHKSITAYDLDQKEFAPVKWAVPDLIPEGVTILCGRPKTGKSWLMLNIALAVAKGDMALGKKQCEQGRVLYAANEDNERRLQKRGRVLSPQGEMPKDLTYWSNNSLKRLNEGGINQIKSWLAENQDTRLVIIDTLASVKPIKNGGEQFLNDYDVGSMLQSVAQEHNIAIVVIHHTRKAESNDAVDEISGTLGLVAGFDGYLTLKRTPQKECDGVLIVDGRDIENGGELALSWDHSCALWSLLGDACEYNTTTERKQIKDLIMDQGTALNGYRIAELLGKKEQVVKKTCLRMVDAGELMRTKKNGDRKTYFTISNPRG